MSNWFRKFKRSKVKKFRGKNDRRGRKDAAEQYRTFLNAWQQVMRKGKEPSE